MIYIGWVQDSNINLSFFHTHDYIFWIPGHSPLNLIYFQFFTDRSHVPKLISTLNRILYLPKNFIITQDIKKNIFF